MKKALFFSFLLLFCLWSIAQNPSTIQETKRVFTTYPFSDPNPVAKPANIFYPYFRFEGYSAKGVDKEWKVVELENDYIKLSIFPEIGGKLWGAVEKSTKNEFLYFNHSVKFRDIAMRGPWTSGGIEFNFGIIGHAPTASTPVDYLMKTNADGSVSCFISAIELITRTMWSVEVNLPKDKAYFTTKTIYYNSSSVEKPYYHWMNAGYKARGNLEFCFPGQYQIGHGGEVYPFPINEAGRNISWYEKNNFGTSKSYHVVGKYNDFYAAYWHDTDFGSAHYAPYDEKPGMKIFLWGLCREGGIWEGLLTDTDGQYVELQSGRMYNQAASNSILTPYKLFPFMPLSTDSWTEYWFPIKGTEGVSKISPLGALNVIRKNDHLEILFCPLQKIASKITVSAKDSIILTKELNLKILEPWKESILIDQIPAGPLRIVLGDNELVYSENPADNSINRPSVTPENFDWNSVYGLYLEGEQWLNYKAYDKAEIALKKCLDLDPNYLPALNKMASISYRRGHYKNALDFCKTSLSINAYDGMANYLYGLINTEIGEYTDAKDGFSVASYSMEVRSAAYSKLAQRYLFDKDWTKAEHYALKSLNFNSKNLDAVQVLMIVYRKSNLQEKAKILIADALKDLPLNHYVRFEFYLLNPTEDAKAEFTSMVRNEFPYETYIELAGWYESVGCWDEALRLLSFASEYPVALYRTAYILHKQGKQSESLQVLTRANALSPFLVFPFRIESLNALVWALKEQPDWKINYYIALIYWNNGDTVKALDLLNTCEKVDYAPFYMSRALLKTGTDQLNDLLLSEKLEPGWRVGLGLINYYLQVDDKTNACQIASKYYTKYPNNYMIGLKYAKALCLNQKYTESLQLLTKLVVLPNEGSYEGRTVYRDANLYQSIAYLNKKQYARARQAVEKSELWIENLGVGKPYDRDIDDRLENFILACIYQKQGNKSEANRYLEKICAGYAKDQVSFNSNDYLTALALRETGNAKEADYLMSNWMKKQPDSKIFQWCNAMYNNEEQKAGKLFSERYNLKESIIPWETVRNDYNFNVIVELLKVI